MSAPEQVAPVALTQLQDEDLALLYRRLHWPLLARIVLERNCAWIMRRARKQAESWHLQSNDLEDVQEVGLLACYKALDHFPLSMGDSPTHSPLRPFLCNVLHDAVFNYIRGIKRHARREVGGIEGKPIFELFQKEFCPIRNHERLISNWPTEGRSPCPLRNK
jgi:DNA-directed RNA polymerase specialized sigma24 family protein